MKQKSTNRNLPYSIVLYDHSCALCRREMANLKKRDHLQRLLMIDISHPDFDHAIWGFEMEALNAALHVKTTAGEWLTGLPAIHYIYQQVGLGWLWWPSRLPVLSGLSKYAYAWFARNRHRLSSHFCTTCSVSQSSFKPSQETTANQTRNGGAA